MGKINIIARGDIVAASLPHMNNETSMMKGDRPVIVVQNEKANTFSSTVIVVPLTKNLEKAYSEKHPNHVLISLEDISYFYDESAFLSKSVALCEQVLTIDKSYLIKRLGRLNKSKIWELNNALQISMQLI